MEQIGRRKFLKSGLALLVGFLGCDDNPKKAGKPLSDEYIAKLVFDSIERPAKAAYERVIEGKIIRFYEGQVSYNNSSSIKATPNVLEILNASNQLEKLIQDYNEDGIIGSNQHTILGSALDAYMVVEGKKEYTYTPRFVNVKDLVTGEEKLYADKDMLNGIYVGEVKKEKLKEATGLYQRHLREIEQSIK